MHRTGDGDGGEMSSGPSARDALISALRSHAGAPCEFLLVTNSIRVRFDISECHKGKAYVWIDPPWQLREGDVIVTGSADCPDGDEGEEYRARWLAWVAHFDPLEEAVFADASVGVEHPDLRLGFESGHWVETFSSGGPGCWWYYLDREADEVFEAGAEGIVRKQAGQS
jgi:hypothetical protein